MARSMTAGTWFRRVPWSVVACSLLLMAIGLSGIARGDEITGKGVFFTRQLMWAILSVPAMLLCTLVSYRLLRGWSYPMFAVSIVLLVVVYFLPAKNGAHRWIPLGISDFQPSEMAKLSFIMSLAQYLMYRRNYRSIPGLVAPFLLMLVPMGLILREPDLGTSLVFPPILYAMLFAAGARPRHLIFVALLGVAVLPVLWMSMSAEQKSRVVTLFVQEDGGPAPRGDGYQLHQAKQMLSLGGVWGSEVNGMTLDDPLAYHLPACRTDFIFCLIGERWGLLGCTAVLLLYALLFARGMMIAASTREPFGRLLAVGIVALLATQTLINSGMTVGLMPVTGLTLPLLSHGGSSLLITSICIGLLLNVGMRPGYEMTPEPFRFRATPAPAHC